jgi:DNA-binding NtrC family response regulator
MSEQMMKLLGSAPEYLRAVHAARLVAGTDTTVLLVGEQGSGRQLLAREIHACSRYGGLPFRGNKCAGKGAGDLEQALGTSPSGGTLFLDGVEDLCGESQAKLLQLIERRESGESKEKRIIASTATDLHRLQQEGRFREDLFFRLHVVPIDLPPLRERRDDIILMLKHFTIELAHHHGRKPPRYSVSARNLIKQYRWPGNVRELRNFCERMVILSAGNIVQPENMPVEMRRPSDSGRESSGFILPEDGIDLFSLESDMILQALRMAGGNRSKAARLLGISRDTLLYRIQKHAIAV